MSKFKISDIVRLKSTADILSAKLTNAFLSHYLADAIKFAGEIGEITQIWPSGNIINNEYYSFSLIGKTAVLIVDSSWIEAILPVSPTLSINSAPVIKSDFQIGDIVTDSSGIGLQITIIGRAVDFNGKEYYITQDSNSALSNVEVKIINKHWKLFKSATGINSPSETNLIIDNQIKSNQCICSAKDLLFIGHLKACGKKAPIDKKY